MWDLYLIQNRASQPKIGQIWIGYKYKNEMNALFDFRSNICIQSNSIKNVPLFFKKNTYIFYINC